MTSRNDPCSCGSGKKYKQCCMRQEPAQAVGEVANGNAGQAASSYFNTGNA
ncbi:MAG: SEC-C domain-containing protein, partial [Nitrosomonadales bacterium]|nr:SEC-C domain-containing protein [Nitrosomonadales bacterium]